MRDSFTMAATAAGLGRIHPVLYMGRHSGASLDRLTAELTLLEVQRRGRWRSPASVRRYDKHALIQAVTDMLSAEQLLSCDRAAAKLPAMHVASG